MAGVRGRVAMYHPQSSRCLTGHLRIRAGGLLHVEGKTEAMTDQDLQLPWEQAGWLEQATAWIHAELGRQRIGVTGSIEVLHMRAWSAFARVPTTSGAVYFKAPSPALRFEAALAQALARWRPDCIPPILAVDLDQGWTLSADAGVTLRSLGQTTAQLPHWHKILPLYVEVQIELATRVDQMLVLGAPDRRLAALPQLYDQLLADTENLRVGRPQGLTLEEHRCLLDLQGRFAARCEQLAAYGLPETIAHEEVHENNVVVRDGRYVFTDWSDSSVAHPFFSMLVTLRAAAHWLGLAEQGPQMMRLRDIYLEAWSNFGTRQDLLSAFQIAYRLAMVNRSLSWYSGLDSLPEKYKVEYDGVCGWLQDFLEAETQAED